MIFLNYALLFMLLVIMLQIFREGDNYKLILYAAFFSFATACLYFINGAPDLALAEISIGAAFIPLIFTIAIMRQNTFTVVFFSEEGKQAYCDPEVLIEFMGIAEVFCSHHRLKLKIITHPHSYEPSVRGIFRLGNTDLIAHYMEEDATLHVWGNTRNRLIPELFDAFGPHAFIQINEMGGEWVEE